MKFYIYLSVSVFVGLSGFAKAQSLSLMVDWYECRNSCSNGFAYKGRVVIDNDYIRLYSFTNNSEECVSKFAIINERTKWKIRNRTGFVDYKVVQLFDSTKAKIKLSLKEGSGSLEFSGGKLDFTLQVSKQNL